jgi:hypothetical protein
MVEQDSEQEIAAIIEALDDLVEQVERHLHSLKGEAVHANASGDPRYVWRVERGANTAQQLLDILDEEVQERVMLLRHNAHQLGYAREGKMV